MKPINLSFIILTAFLFVFWLIVSGSFDIQHIAIGILVSTMVSYHSITTFDYKIKSFSLTKALLYVRFVVVLLIEITKANLYVARIVLDPSLPISPGLVRIKTGLKSEFLITLLANSITLTPGTLTVDVNKDEILVHVLTDESGKNLKDWQVLKILKKLEVV